MTASGRIRLSVAERLRREGLIARKVSGWGVTAAAALVFASLTGLVLQDGPMAWARGGWDLGWRETGLWLLISLAILAPLSFMGWRLQAGREAGYVLTFVPNGEDRHRAGVEHMLLHCVDQVDLSLPLATVGSLQTQVRLGQDIAASVLDTQVNARRQRPNILRLAVQAPLPISMAVGQQLRAVLQSPEKRALLVHTDPFGGGGPRVEMSLEGGSGMPTMPPPSAGPSAKKFGEVDRLDIAVLIRGLEGPSDGRLGEAEMLEPARRLWAAEGGGPERWLFACAEGLTGPHAYGEFLTEITNRLLYEQARRQPKAVRFYLRTPDYFAVALGASLHGLSSQVMVEVAQFGADAAGDPAYVGVVHVNASA